MSGTSLTFTECELIVNQNRHPRLSDFENKQKYILMQEGVCLYDLYIYDKKSIKSMFQCTY